MPFAGSTLWANASPVWNAIAVPTSSMALMMSRTEKPIAIPSLGEIFSETDDAQEEIDPPCHRV